jgi:hypothetical protein
LAGVSLTRNPNEPVESLRTLGMLYALSPLRGKRQIAILQPEVPGLGIAKVRN